MIVVVGSDRPPLLADPDDCTRFHVAHAGGDLADGLAALGGCLAADGDALVPVAWVRTATTAAAADLEAMLTYAAANGWLQDGMIRAHVDPA